MASKSNSRLYLAKNLLKIPKSKCSNSHLHSLTKFIRLPEYKRSQSQIIAMILLILLVLTIIIVLWNVVGVFVSESTSSVASQKKCAGVILSIDKISPTEFSIKKSGGKTIQPEPLIVVLADGQDVNCLWEPADPDWSKQGVSAKCTLASAPAESLEAHLIVDEAVVCPFRGLLKISEAGTGGGGTGGSVCGNSVCESGESCSSCPGDCVSCPVVCTDNDNDGYGNPASSSCTFPQLDCNDNNNQVNPGVNEVCTNGVDDDCDSKIDSADSDCTLSQVPTGYVAYLKFEDNVNDETGVNNGQTAGVPIYISNGQVGKAILLAPFDGTADYAYLLTDHPSLKITGPITISAWIFPTDLNYPSGSDGGYIFSKRESTTGGYFLRLDKTGKINFKLYGGDINPNGRVSSKVLTTGEWHHVVGVYSGESGGTISVYIDGIAETEALISGTSFGDTTRVPFIGANPTNGNNPFNGAIDELIVYDRGLSQSEVKGIYCSQGGTTGCP